MSFSSVLVTGDRGYIGSVLVERLAQMKFSVCGLDTGYFSQNIVMPVFESYRQVTKDIRDISADDIAGFDAIIHLAALSNDPLGELAPELTEQINLQATIRLATLAKLAGVKRFIYSSSQSMYGVAETEQELDEEAAKHPITAYARTKWDAEQALFELADDQFTIVAFRPSTVFGMSPRLRTDIVFNNLLASAFTRNVIEIKSDGSPWRPVIHVEDVCSAFIAGLLAPADLVQKQAFNVGIRNVNYRVRDIADAVHTLMPHCALTYSGEHGSDSRTYRVCFNKINSVLADFYQPEWDLLRGGEAMLKAFRQYGFPLEHFTGRTTNRLNQLKFLLQEQQLNADLYWS
jgi:nucleoside-diphosphate-sugar epimerase